MGLRKRPGQISLEYLLIIGFTFAIIIPGIYFFQAYSQSSVSGFGTAQYDKLGNEIVGTAVQTLAQGKGSWLTLDLLVPESVLNISVDDDGRELVISYLGPYGPTEAVFFSDEVAIRDKDANDGTIYQSGVHGGRLTLKFVAGSNNNVSIEEDTGWWTLPVEYCETNDECRQHWRDLNDCYHRALCDNEVCTFDIPPDPDSLGSFGGCDGDFRFTGMQCIFNLTVEADCTDDGWTCPHSTQTVNCQNPGVITVRDGDTPLCWHRLPEITGTDLCNATGCHVNADDRWRCGSANCNATFGWNNTLCLGDLPHIYSIYLNATDSPVNSTDANLTAWPNGISNPNEGYFSILYDWRVNDESIAVVNMHFDVNESAGENKTRDYSTWENHATLGDGSDPDTMPRWNRTGGWNGSGAYEFDGVDDYIHINTPDIDNATPITVSFYFKPGQNVFVGELEDYYLIDKNADFAFWLRAVDVGRLRFLSYSGNRVSTTVEWNKVDWYHVVGVYYNVSYAELFINGVKESVPGSMGPISVDNDDIYIGTRQALDTFFFEGAMDNFLIMNRALSEREVLALYENKTMMLDSQQTRGGDTWQVCGVPSDGIYNGSMTCSNELFIKNTPPSISSLLLQASDHPVNSTDADLNAIPTIYDVDGYPVHILYDWRVAGKSIAVVNMPFDVEHGVNNETKDYTSYSNNGTLGDGLDIDTMPTWNKTGGWNDTGAYVFDDDDSIIIPGSDLSTAPFSVSFWFKPNTTINAAPPEIYNIFEKDDNGNRANGFQIFFTADAGRMRFRSYSGAIWTNTALWEDDEWYHIVAVYDGGTGNDMMYVNGVVDNYNNDYTLENLNMNSEDFVLGNNPHRPLEYGLPATFDNVQVFKRALSAEQVVSMYANRTDLIESEETTVGETWSVCGTPNDGSDDGVEVCSNDVTIVGAPCQSTPIASDYLYCREMTIGYESIGTLTDYQVEVDMDPLHQKLIASWHLDEGSGTTTQDGTGLGYTGSITGATWTAGLEGQGLDFDGAWDYVDIPVHPISDEFTITMWIKPDTNINMNPLISNSDNNLANGWRLILNHYSTTQADGALIFETNGGQAYGSAATADAAVTIGSWQHIAVTANRLTGEVHIYKNGVDITTDTITNTGFNLAGTWHLGRFHNDNTYWYQGDMDEVRIHDGQLTEDEIRMEFCTGQHNLGVMIMSFDCIDYIKTYSYTGEDYRFTDTSGNLRDYWVEHDNKAWVKMPTISALAAIPKSYLYYGKKNAGDAGNPDNTFILFDDFNDGVVDTNKWTTTETGTGTVTEANGIIDIYDPNTISRAELWSVKNVAEPVVVERVLYFPNQPGTARNRFGPRYYPVDTGVFNTNLQIYWSGTWTGTYMPLNTWLDMEHRLQSSTFTWRILNHDTQALLYQNSNTGAANTNVYTTAGDGSGGQYGRIQMDSIRARVYATTLPTATFGAENG